MRCVLRPACQYVRDAHAIESRGVVELVSALQRLQSCVARRAPACATTAHSAPQQHPTFLTAALALSLTRRRPQSRRFRHASIRIVVQKTARVQASEPEPLAPPAVTQTTANPDVLAPLPDAEIKRRLRRLGEPVTLFGEDADVRRARLQLAEATLEVADDDAGAGDRANVLLSIAKEDKERARRGAAGEAGTSKGGGGGVGNAGPSAAGATVGTQDAVRPCCVAQLAVFFMLQADVMH